MENLVKSFKNKKVLVTGHTGFKGAWLSKILLNAGAQVSGIALKPEAGPNLFESLKIKKDINNHLIDIRNFEKVKKAIATEKPEIIFHLAAQPIVRAGYDRPIYTFETNLLGTLNILEAVKEVGKVRSLVIITTDKVYRNRETGRNFKEDDSLGGHDPYSASKAAAEIAIESYTKSFFHPDHYNDRHQTLIASARAGNVIGGGDWGKDRLVTDLVNGVMSNKSIVIRSPDAIRPWQFVLEALSGYLLLADHLHAGKKELSGAWNFGPHQKNVLTVKEFTELAFKILGKGKFNIKKDTTGKHEATLLRLNSDKAKRELGWKQKLDLNETLNMTFDWYKTFYNKEDVRNITDDQIKSFFN